MKNVLLTIEYDGSAFHGWQEQPGLRTVQGVLQDALSTVLGFDVKVNGTSRTDAGVHALGQCLSFSGEFGIPTENIPLAVNNVLSKGRTGGGTIPGDIRVLECKEVPLDFHARFDCKKKTYRYVLNQGKPNVFRRNYCYYVDGPLDVENMERAGKLIEGTHDFACFQSAGGNPRESTVRTVYELKVHKDKEDIVIQVTGDGFLYNMVRIIVGTLVEVGQGKREASDITEIISSGDRSMAGHTAPAQGLYLSKIYFD
ncbi:MAG: tRNA pseudouridine(38-40) synthase TruA [Firmicutes bacterium]|nr:tRNA pseudouridine(38-40) synthase TruA [Bacillota bacterium]